MLKSIKPLVVLMSGVLLVVRVQAEEYCESRWLVQQYRVCENQSKPILGENVDATCPGDPACEVIYKECRTVANGLDDSTAREITTVEMATDWVVGGSDQERLCRQAIAMYNKEMWKVNPDQKAIFVKVIPEKEKSIHQWWRLSEQYRYQYTCRAKVSKYEYNLARNEECGIEGYKKPKIVVAYEKDRNDSCGLEGEVLSVTNRSDVNSIEGVADARCLTCDQDFKESDLKTYSQCLSANIGLHVFNEENPGWNVVTADEAHKLVERVHNILDYIENLKLDFEFTPEQIRNFSRLLEVTEAPKGPPASSGQ